MGDMFYSYKSTVVYCVHTEYVGHCRYETKVENKTETREKLYSATFYAQDTFKVWVAFVTAIRYLSQGLLCSRELS